MTAQLRNPHPSLGAKLTKCIQVVNPQPISGHVVSRYHL